MDAITISDQVTDLLSRIAPMPICDACIARKLGLAREQQINSLTRQLAGRPGYERRRDICAACYEERLVTRRP